jgi:hypothetical protein
MKYYKLVPYWALMSSTLMASNVYSTNIDGDLFVFDGTPSSSFSLENESVVDLEKIDCQKAINALENHIITLANNNKYHDYVRVRKILFSLSLYRFQVFGLISNTDGSKSISINAYRINAQNPATASKFIMCDGGGHDYFFANINLRTGKVYFSINDAF